MKKKIIGYVITHGHMDIEWYMPLRLFRFWTVEALDELRRIAKEQPGFVTYVLDGVTCVLDIYFDARPEARKDIERLVKEGKLAIGPFYSQFDEWLTSAESMVRNCLYGNRKCREYGKIMKAGYLPDNFGHPRQIPQILNDFGIDSLLFMRGMPEIPGGHPDEFVYVGLDGSKVLASHFRDSYGGAFNIYDKDVDPMQPRGMPYYKGYYSYEYYMELADHSNQKKIAEELIQNVRRIKDRYPSGIVPLIAGCDHCPPQAKMGETLKLANSMQDEIEFVMGDAESYIREVQSRINNPMQYSDELIGSFYQHILFGALSTRSYLKRQNFAAEVLMERYAEPLDAYASMLGRSGTQPQLDEAWKYLMINSAHDSIHGSSVDEVHVEMEFRYAAVGQIATGLAHDSLKYIVMHMKPWWEGMGKGIVTFSPSNPGMPQLGKVWLPIADDKVCIYDKYGNALPTQILPREKIELNGMAQLRNTHWPHEKFRNVLFLASSEANMVNTFVCKREDVKFNDIDAGDNYIENEYLRVELDGALINILDKINNIWYFGLNLIEEEADAGDAWDFSPPWIPGETVLSNRFDFKSSLVESGPVRAVIKSAGKMNVPYKLEGDKRSATRVDIPMCFEISMERYSKRVDIKLTFENNARDHRMRLRIPMGVKTDKVISQGHYGIIERPIERPRETEPWRQPPTQILPFREWVAVDDGKRGLAIAVKGIYDYEAILNPLSNTPDICLTLLRGIEYMGRINTMQRKGDASRFHHTPGAQCYGKHVVEWSYIPYAVDKDDKAPFIPIANNFLYPMMTHMVRLNQLDEIIGEEMLPFAFLNNNVQFSAFKRSYDGNDFILRFYENQGKCVEAVIQLNGFKKVYLSNMNEEICDEVEFKDNIIRMKVEPYKVVTLLLKQ